MVACSGSASVTVDLDRYYLTVKVDPRTPFTSNDRSAGDEYSPGK